MSEWYILNGDKQPVPVDMMEWARLTKGKNRIVAKTNIGEARISTIFLGLDHGQYGDGPPVLFETMIFGGPEDGYQERYCTWDEAVEGHKKTVAEQKRLVS